MNVLNVSDLTDAEAAVFINFITSQIVRCLILFCQNLQLFQDKRGFEIMTYAEEFFNNYLKPKGIKTFTHRDMLIHTDTNCTYSVLRCLKAYLGTIELSVREEKEERINSKNQKKYYKRYYIEVI